MYVGPLGLGHGAFDDHVVHLAIIISSLPFVFEVGIRASDDGVDCVMGGEIIALLWGILDLKRRWR
jgi:hypothetical protein